MTEASPPNPHVEPLLAPGSLYSPDARLSNGVSLFADPPAEEDDYLIRCICGFPDDDGNTVLCEECNTWQHIECYYPNLQVPDIHQCASCQPRPIDAKSATDRQKQARTATLPGEKKTKRPQPRSHKKKVKETTPLVNGGPHIEKFDAHDRASGSPHDPPPAKRPKTSHRASSSTASINKDITSALSRRRNNSVALHTGSPVKNPASPVVNGHHEQFSPEFMRLYDNDWQKTPINSFSGLAVSNDLTAWLEDIDKFQAVTNGKTQNEVLKRWDQPWEKLEEASPGFTIKTEENTSVLIHGKHPIFKLVVVDREIMPRSYIGELNGCIGPITDYKEDPSNKWDSLLHPEPFVFFHPDLPIYIDARHEGSDLRFVRRSCRPNSKIEIIIVGKTYHFCLITDKEMNSQDEITISWTYEERFKNLSLSLGENRLLLPEDADHVKSYLLNLLANFGGCACTTSQTCLLERAMSIAIRSKEASNRQPKVSRKKGRKHLTQVSPLSTGMATNSRAGSETVNQMDIDDDAMDSRSASGSARSKPSSRDITPATMMEPSIGLGVGLSTREQRKLQQQERLFEKMENDRSGRKRNSGGSALNTPTVSTSVSSPRHQASNSLTRLQRRLGHPDSTNPSPTSIISSAKTTGSRTSKRPMPNGVTSHSHTSKPIYIEAATQTINTVNDVDGRSLAGRKQSGCVFALRLLQRTRRSHFSSKESTPSSFQNDLNVPALNPRVDTETSVQTEAVARNMPPPPPPPSHTVKSPQLASSLSPKEEPKESEDVEMKDADVHISNPPIQQPENIPMKLAEAPKTPSFSHHESAVSAQPPTPSPPPPETAGDDLNTRLGAPLNTSPTKPTLHMPVLPAQFPGKIQLQSPVSTPSTPQPNGPAALNGASITPAPLSALVSPILLQSPTTSLPGPLVSPSMGTSPALPSPAKKRISLSDYAKRKKVQDEKAATQAAQSSPLATLEPLSAKVIAEESSVGFEKPIQSDNGDKLSSITGQIVSEEPMQVDPVAPASLAEMEIDTKNGDASQVT
jgi:uncharacterized protein